MIDNNYKINNNDNKLKKEYKLNNND